MGDRRFEDPYHRLEAADDRPRVLREMTDEDVIAALAAASRADDPYVANVLATEATNRVRRATAISRHLGEGVYALDPEGRVTFLNPAAERMLGWTLDELKGLDFHETVHHRTESGEPMPREACATHLTLETGREHHRRDHGDAFTRKDGTTFPVEITSAPIVQDGVVRGAVAVFGDLTEERAAERAVLELAAIAESSQDAIMTETADGVVTNWNPAAERLFAYSRDEMVGRSMRPLIPPDREDELALTRRAANGERVPPYETVRIRKDGSRVDVSLSLSPLTSREGRVGGVVALYRDITERKRTEAELHRSRDLLRAVVEGTTDAVYAKDRDGRYLFANSAVAVILGASHDTIVGHTDAAFLQPAAARSIHETDESVMRSGRSDRREERIETPDGRERVFLSVKDPLLDEAGRVIGLVGISRDVTDEKRAREEVRARERRHRLLVQEVKDYAIFMLDPDGHVTSWNEGAERLTGYVEDEILGEHFRAFYPADARERQHAEHELRVAADEGVYKEEGWRVRKDGSTYWARVTLTALRDEEDDLVGFGKVTHDLTSERAREMALRDAFDSMEQVVRNAPTPMIAFNANGVLTVWNRAAEKRFGWSSREVVGKPLPIVPPEREEEFRAKLAALRRGASLEGTQTLVRHRDNARFEVRMNLEPLMDEHGNLARVVGTLERL